MHEEQDSKFNTSKYTKIQNNQHQLKYQPHSAEGQCTLLYISPVRFVKCKFALFVIANIFLFIPLLLTYWNDKYKRKFYMTFCQLSEATHFYIINHDEQISIVPKQTKNLMVSQNVKVKSICFVNRYLTYIIDGGEIVKLCIYDPRQRIKQLTNQKIEQKGLSQAYAHHLKYTYGPGTMIVRKPTILELLIFQVIKPLYIFLIFSVFFWFFAQAYYYFAITLLVIFIIGVIINLYQMVQLNNKIFSMAYYQITINVLRNGVVKPLSSVDVVPGDVVFLKDPIKIPFQGIILEGSALINECALTGESVPVVKKADRLSRMHQHPSKIDKNSIVYQGTTIVQTSDKKRMQKYQKYRQQFGIPVCVTKTNFITSKGQLIRIILFPKQQQNKFQKEAFKFLFFLFLFAIISYIPLTIINIQYQNTIDIIYKFIDLILIAVPPALPVSMTFGIIYAIEKLQKKSIFCIQQNKVITGGIIQFACFDKTGTLTQDFMDFYCAVPSYQGKFHTQIVNNQQMANYIINNIHQKPYYMPILNNMATNHSIVRIQSSGEMIGDPMEIKTFNFGKFQLTNSQEQQQSVFSFNSQRGHKGTVYRRYQFESQLQRMSVVAKTSTSDKYQVYAKGSPQMMLNIMRNSSVPKNYNEMLKEYASHGFRVLSIASKTITEEQMKIQGREDIQRELYFNGFEVFENKLKPQTKGAIQELKQAKIGVVMITGDNTLTGSNISYKCCISQKEKGLILVDYVANKLSQQIFIFHDYDNNKDFPADKPIAQSYIQDDIKRSQFSKLSQPRSKISSRDRSLESFQPMKDSNQQFMFNVSIKAEETQSQICITGRAFNQLFSGAVSDITPIHKKFISQITVFARTKPNDKAKIVMVYQQMGKKTSMCGDGANDCGALKQADIGLSLSQAEASISAPFTSQVTNITSMVQLIKECRAGLATNFSLFNIMAIYSLIQSTSSIIAQFYLSYPADLQYLYWDLVLNFSLIIFIGYTGTSTKLSVQKPRNTLFSITNICQILFMFFVQIGGHLLAIFIFKWIDEDYYNQFGGFDNNKKYYEENQDFRLDGVEGSIIFVFSNNIYLFSALAFNISKPWRKQFYTNIPLIIISVLVLAFNIVMNLFDWADWSQFYLIHFNKDEVRYFLLLQSLAFSIFIYVCQKCLWEPLTFKLTKKYEHKHWI